jgi:predicted nucleic acid-binding protein
MSGVVYLDASALVKLVLAERESEAVRAAVGATAGWASSAVAAVEVHRALRRAGAGPDEARQADAVLRAGAMVSVSGAILDAARAAGPPALRALDAIHLVSALSVRRHLSAFCCYDSRLAAAAADAGLPVIAPAG